MSKANTRDEAVNSEGAVVYYKQWPATRTGQIDDNGTLRAMDTGELAEWDTAEAETQTAAALAADDADLADIIATVLARLDTFTNFSGTANNTQLTVAVKDLSRIVARIVRTLDRRDVI